MSTARKAAPRDGTEYRPLADDPIGGARVAFTPGSAGARGDRRRAFVVPLTREVRAGVAASGGEEIW